MMTTFPDLTPYKSDLDKQIGVTPLAVGFLQRGKPFPTGKNSPEFLEKLLRFCLPEHTVAQSRMIARCAVGENCPRVLPPVLYDEVSVYFGSSEIRVIGEEEIYAAPTLIYHYVLAHDYRPPEVFVQAVLSGPQPESAEHRAIINTLNRI
jgi:hypothetical protein